MKYITIIIISINMLMCVETANEQEQKLFLNEIYEPMMVVSVVSLITCSFMHYKKVQEYEMYFLNYKNTQMPIYLKKCTIAYEQSIFWNNNKNISIVTTFLLVGLTVMKNISITRNSSNVKFNWYW